MIFHAAAVAAAAGYNVFEACGSGARSAVSIAGLCVAYNQIHFTEPSPEIAYHQI